MELNDFLKNFANQFDDTEVGAFSADTLFHDLDEWSSLVALAIMNMIAKKYGVVIKIDELKKFNTIQELFEFVQTKK